jgi:hypothetical protein
MSQIRAIRRTEAKGFVLAAVCLTGVIAAEFVCHRLAWFVAVQSEGRRFDAIRAHQENQLLNE